MEFAVDIENSLSEEKLRDAIKDEKGIKWEIDTFQEFWLAFNLETHR